MESSPPLPFVLTLHPLLPLRARRHRRTLDLGYQLRLVDGPALADDDVLLDAFGAFVVPLVGDDHDAEALQHEAFASGRRLTLLPEGVDRDGDAVVGVWDADGIRRAGVVPYEKAAVVAAAAEAGLTVAALVLREERAVLDDRREDLTLLMHAPAIVRVDVPAGPMEGVEREWLRLSLESRTQAL